MLKSLVLSFCCLMLTAGASLQAQTETKYAYANTGFILLSLPETIGADTLLGKFRDSLTDIRMEIEMEYQERGQWLMQNRDNMTPRAFEASRDTLAALEEQMSIFPQQAQMLMETRRQQYLGPILQRVRDAVTAYATEHNYLMVFDSAEPGVVLFADQQIDITRQIIESLDGDVSVLDEDPGESAEMPLPASDNR